MEVADYHILLLFHEVKKMSELRFCLKYIKQCYEKGHIVLLERFTVFAAFLK